MRSVSVDRIIAEGVLALVFILGGSCIRDVLNSGQRRITSFVRRTL